MWCHQSFNHLIDFRDNLIATLFNLWNFETEEAVGRKAEHVYYMVPLCWCLINKLMCLCHVYIRLNGLCDVFVFFVSEYVHLQFCAVAWLWLKQCLNYHLDTLHLHSTWKNMLSLLLFYTVSKLYLFSASFSSVICCGQGLGSLETVDLSQFGCPSCATQRLFLSTGGATFWWREAKGTASRCFLKETTVKNPLLLGWQVIFFGGWLSDPGLGVGRAQMLYRKTLAGLNGLEHCSLQCVKFKTICFFANGASSCQDLFW